MESFRERIALGLLYTNDNSRYPRAMPPFLTAFFSFLCIFGGAVAGLILQRFLPAAHLSKDSQESVKLGAGLIATMAALILGLLVSSSKGTYDRVNALINQSAANVINLDETLRAIGPRADTVREVLNRQFLFVCKDIWPEEFACEGEPVRAGGLAFDQSISALNILKMISEMETPEAAAADLKKNAILMASTINKDRWQVIVEATSNTPMALVVIPVFWITFLTFIYGVYAQRNATVITVLFCCSVSIAGAIYLICQMSTPLSGPIKVPSIPFHKTIKALNL